MTNKIKSLIYLSCFIVASVVYHEAMNSEPKEELATNTIEQEADIIINPYKEYAHRIETN
ncbi:hypothetical protein ACNR9Q_00090 [Maribacter sp. X9]|uniref:hypothetical protein n=1 Tax=Maribacter sp. X9 TaxID=3402159 RepID=UPI003AF35912